jgi:hypothetical protein
MFFLIGPRMPLRSCLGHWIIPTSRLETADWSTFAYVCRRPSVYRRCVFCVSMVSRSVPASPASRWKLAHGSHALSWKAPARKTECHCNLHLVEAISGLPHAVCQETNCDLLLNASSAPADVRDGDALHIIHTIRERLCYCWVVRGVVCQ